MKRIVVIACEGTAATGLGHLNRCLAYAESCQRLGAELVFMGRFEPVAQTMIIEGGFEVGANPMEVGESPCQLSAEASRRGAVVVVVDSYNVSEAYLSKLRSDLHPCRLVVIDDFAALGSYSCDTIINFTASGPQRMYKAPGAELLLGPGFMPAREWLRQLRSRGVSPDPRGLRTVIFPGGGDRCHVSLRLIRALQAVAPDATVRLVASKHHPDRAKLEELLSTFELPGEWVSLASTMASALENADVVLCGGGLTKYECCFLGIPSAALSQTIEQDADTRLLEEEGMAFNLGQAGSVTDAILQDRLGAFLRDEGLRQRIRKRGLDQIPEDSAQRVAGAILFDFPAAVT